MRDSDKANAALLSKTSEARTGTEVVFVVNNIDAIHLISHGSVGARSLGTQQLNSATLKSHAAQLAQPDAECRCGQQSHHTDRQHDHNRIGQHLNRQQHDG